MGPDGFTRAPDPEAAAFPTGLVPNRDPDTLAPKPFGYALRKHDQDGDGIPDRSDKCPHVPEDRDGFQDEDGCADDDNYGDQIVDEDDRCPAEPAEWGHDDDEDGCTDSD